MTHSPAVLDIDACVEATLARVGKRIVLGLPVGIGKPNPLVNCFVQRAVADPSIELTLFTALSLRTPRWRSDLERRFLEPFATRVFGAYPELEYVQLLERRKLPPNIRVNEFFLEPGAWLHHDHLQQQYLSANYTHVARDLIARGVNVIAQSITPMRPDGTVSLSCNPDLTVDLLPYIRSRRAAGQPFALIGYEHPDLPFMFGDACIAREDFDLIVANRESPYPLFCPPNMPIGTTDYMIALNVAALIKDGGTLQLGIGELGDAIVYALKLRHEQPQEFSALLEGLGTQTRHRALIEHEGGAQPFAKGLYGCTEMLVDGFIDLYRAGILKRRVYPHAVLQRLLDEGRIAEQVDESMLQALIEAGLDTLTAEDFAQLQMAGVIRENACYERETAKLATSLGTHLKSGVLAHGGFFFGPAAFYQSLREMPDEERRLFAMQRISFVNELYDDAALKRIQRRDARFVNTTMMVTGLGAAVSDGLADSKVVSGIGGQYNFVAMAHALPGARSILCLRSTRTTQGKTTSNIVWNYGHVSIPRHLRDIVVTEYGVADLRGKTDAEVAAALIGVMDARFIDAFADRAKRAGKLPADYQAPDHARANTPQRLEAALHPYRQRDIFPAMPFGGEFTAEELRIAQALKRLQAATLSWPARLRTLLQSLTATTNGSDVASALARLRLDKPQSIDERITRQLVAWALNQAPRR